ncbi:14-3-3 protein, putative [Hepatocystis sp. ex Piliocolobus tephrosceles]|nr:14-3-3 protein, putative [Hepatocystis sp. ex Piliocolobus tephrosceles]
MKAKNKIENDLKKNLSNSSVSKYLMSKYERKSTYSEKMNYGKSIKEDIKNKTDLTTKKNSGIFMSEQKAKAKSANKVNNANQTNHPSFKIKDKEIIVSEKGKMKKEQTSHIKKKEKESQNVSFNKNTNHDKENDIKKKNIVSKFLKIIPTEESRKHLFDVNFTKKKTNLNKIKKTKKSDSLQKMKTVGDVQIKMLSEKNVIDHKKTYKNKSKVLKCSQTTYYGKQSLESTSNSNKYKDSDDNISMTFSEKVEKQREQFLNDAEYKKKIKIEKLKENINKNYKQLFTKYNNNIQELIYSKANAKLKIEINRETLYNFLNISYNYNNYEFALGCAILLLLDRVYNPSIELTEAARDDIENAIKSYSYHFIIAYKYSLKCYKNGNNNNSDNNNNNNNSNNNTTMSNLVIKEKEENNDTLTKKNISKSITIKLKNDFLLNSEAIINIIKCICYTIHDAKTEIYYIHLNANQYKLISDITETGIKYKYEQLAKEAYEKAFDLGKIYLQPLNLKLLYLTNKYIQFLYFNLGYEKKALKIGTEIFDRASNLLDIVENEEEAANLIQILTKLRNNIKSWSSEINKHSILFLGL